MNLATWSRPPTAPACLHTTPTEVKTSSPSMSIVDCQFQNGTMLRLCGYEGTAGIDGSTRIDQLYTTILFSRWPHADVCAGLDRTVSLTLTNNCRIRTISAQYVTRHVEVSLAHFNLKISPFGGSIIWYLRLTIYLMEKLCSENEFNPMAMRDE